jgi:hypothetical protein
MLYDKVIRTNSGRARNTTISDAHFVDGFAYDGKAVFGVVETSDRIETVRMSDATQRNVSHDAVMFIDTCFSFGDGMRQSSRDRS